MLETISSDHNEERIYSAFLYRLTAQNLRSKASSLIDEIQHVADADLRMRLARYADNVRHLALKLEAIADRQERYDETERRALIG